MKFDPVIQGARIPPAAAAGPAYVGVFAVLLLVASSACTEPEIETDAGTELETDTGLVNDPTMLDDPQRVTVTLGDYVIDMPDTIPAGAVVFEAMNRGDHQHSLAIEGQGIEQTIPDGFEPGDTMELAVELTPGTYRLYCPVEDHADAHGMEKQVVARE